MKSTAAALVASCLALSAAPVCAQLPQASAAALGMGYNMTASAKGFAAVANNPAGLGHPASPGFSLAIPALSVETGLGPVTLGDLADQEGRLLSTTLKEEWLARVTEAGGQAGTVGGGVTPLALSVGSVGFQLSARAGGRVDLAPDAAELLLFGNAGRTGSPGDYALTGSSMDLYVLSTAALSYGFRATERTYLGVTAKYTMGNALVAGRDIGSLIDSDPLSVELDFPVLSPPSEDPGYNHGSGIGFDIGAIWEGPSVTLGATIQNVINTFEWDLDGFSYTPGQALFDRDTTVSDFEERPASAAPASVRAIAEGLTLEPVFAVGAEITPSPLLRLQADVRKGIGDGLELDPDFHAGVGAELLAVPVLPLRAHLGVVSGGIQVGGGASLILGPVHISGALALRTSDVDNATLAMLTLSFGAN